MEKPTYTDKELEQLRNDPELIIRAEGLEAAGVGRYKAVKDVAKWHASGRPQEYDPIKEVEEAPDTEVKKSWYAKFRERIVGTKPPSPAKPEPPKATEERKRAEEEEEDEGADLASALPFGLTTPAKLVTETASVASEATAGTKNPGFAGDVPKLTVGEVRRAAGAAAKRPAADDKTRLPDPPGKELRPDDAWTRYANDILDSLSYVGLDTKDIRRQCRETMDFGDLVKALAIYTRVGNAAKRRLKKGSVKDEDAAKDATDFLREHGVQQRVKGTSKLSLPRIAQAYAPVLLTLRIGASTEKLIDTRLDASGSVIYHDVAFGGYYAEADDFHTKFGRVLGKFQAAQSKQEYDEKETDARNAQFRELSKQGLLRDPYLANGIARVKDWPGAENFFYGEVEM